MVFHPLGLAARHAEISRERLGQLANRGDIKVIKDSTGRRFVEDRELQRFLRDRAQSRSRKHAKASP